MNDYYKRGQNTYIIASNTGIQKAKSFHQFCLNTLGLKDGEYRIENVYADKTPSVRTIYRHLMTLVKAQDFNKDYNSIPTTDPALTTALQTHKETLSEHNLSWKNAENKPVSHLHKRYLQYQQFKRAVTLSKTLKEQRRNPQEDSAAYYLTLLKKPTSPSSLWEELIREENVSTSKEDWVEKANPNKNIRIFRKRLFRYDEHKIKTTPFLGGFLLIFTSFFTLNNQFHWTHLWLSKLGTKAAMGAHIYNLCVAGITFLCLVACTAGIFEKAKSEIFRKTETGTKCGFPSVYCMFLLITYVPFALSVWMLIQPQFFLAIGLSPMFVVTLMSLTGKNVGDFIQGLVKNPKQLKQCNDYDRGLIEQTTFVETANLNPTADRIASTKKVNPIHIKSGDYLAIKGDEYVPVTSTLIGVCDLETKTIDKDAKANITLEAINGEPKPKQISAPHKCQKMTQYKSDDAKSLILKVKDNISGQEILGNLVSKDKLLSNDVQEEQKLLGHWPQLFMLVLSLSMLSTAALWYFVSPPGMALQLMLVHVVYVLTCACPIMILSIQVGPAILIMINSDHKKIGVVYTGYNAFTTNFKGDDTSCVSDITGTLTFSPKIDNVRIDTENPESKEMEDTIHKKLYSLENRLATDGNEFGIEISSFLIEKNKAACEALKMTLFDGAKQTPKVIYFSGTFEDQSVISTGSFEYFTSQDFKNQFFKSSDANFTAFKESLETCKNPDKTCSPIVYKTQNDTPKVVGAIEFKKRTIKPNAVAACTLMILRGMHITLLSGGSQKTVVDPITEELIWRVEWRLARLKQLGLKFKPIEPRNYITGIGSCSPAEKAEYIRGTYYDFVEDQKDNANNSIMTQAERNEKLNKRRAIFKKQLEARAGKPLSEEELSQAIESVYKKELGKQVIGLGDGHNDVPFLTNTNVAFIMGDMCKQLKQKTHSNQLVRGEWEEFIKAIKMALLVRKTQNFGMKTLILGGFIPCILLLSGVIYPISQLFGSKGLMLTPATISLFEQMSLLLVSLLIMTSVVKVIKSINRLKTKMDFGGYKGRDFLSDLVIEQSAHDIDIYHADKPIIATHIKPRPCSSVFSCNPESTGARLNPSQANRQANRITAYQTNLP